MGCHRQFRHLIRRGVAASPAVTSQEQLAALQMPHHVHRGDVVKVPERVAPRQGNYRRREAMAPRVGGFPHGLTWKYLIKMRSQRPAFERAAAITFAVGAHQDHRVVDKFAVRLVRVDSQQFFGPVQQQRAHRPDASVGDEDGSFGSELPLAPRFPDQLEAGAMFLQVASKFGGELGAESVAVHNVASPAVGVLKGNEERAGFRGSRQEFVALIRAEDIGSHTPRLARPYPRRKVTLTVTRVIDVITVSQHFAQIPHFCPKDRYGEVMTAFPRALRTAALVAALGLSAVGAAACDSGETSSGGPTNIQKQGLTSNPQKTSTSDIAPLGEANSAMKTQPASAPAKLVPVAMRTGTHQGFDRVVVEFTGEGTPGWHVDYVQLPQQQASGQELKVSGESYLNVNVDGTTYPFEIGVTEANLPPTAGTGPAVAEVISGGTFEGRSQFVIGLKGGPRPYSVSYIEDPKRLVIDFNQN